MASSREQRRVDVFIDVVSPYAWLGFEVLCRYREAWDVDLRVRPAFLGGVMAAAGNTPPAMVPAKGVYMSRDLVRLARHFDLPLKQPEDFMSVMAAGTLKPMRALVAVELARPDLVEEAARQLWLRVWSRNQPVGDADAIRAALVAAGVPDDVVAAALSPSGEVKDALKRSTAEAVGLGAFGFPFIVVYPPPGAAAAGRKPQAYFGSDRFDVIAEELGKRWDGPRGPGRRSRL